jgi:hypothetical protein
MAGWLLDKSPSSQNLQLVQRLRELEKRRDAAALSPTTQRLVNRVQGLKEKLIDPATSEEDRKLFESQIKQFEDLINRSKPQAQSQLSPAELKELEDLKIKIKINSQFTPITTAVISEYLHDTGKTSSPDWWQAYFSADPLEVETATLTHAGAMKLLVDLGYVINLYE